MHKILVNNLEELTKDFILNALDICAKYQEICNKIHMYPRKREGYNYTDREMYKKIIDFKNETINDEEIRSFSSKYFDGCLSYTEFEKMLSQNLAENISIETFQAFLQHLHIHAHLNVMHQSLLNANYQFCMLLEQGRSLINNFTWNYSTMEV